MHFYAGVIAGPVLILLALTGLVILYTDPIHEATQHDLRHVAASSAPVPLQAQVDAAQRTHPDLSIATVIPPKDATSSTQVQFGTDSGGLLDVFVDPGTGKVLGTRTDGHDVVGLANRLHGFLNNESITVTLPSLSHWVDRSAHPESTVKVRVGALIVEIVTVWSLMLALTGIYLWWPRKSQRSKPKLRVRWGKGGRLRWRDLHATSGILVAGVLVLFVVSGMPWSDYWGKDWTTVASKLTPNKEFDTPQSTVAKVGDLDRLGRHIVWSARTDSLPVSQPGPAALTYTDVAAIARQEGMLPGYSIIPPVDEKSDAGATTYGSFMLMNAWPQRLSEQRSLYLDQFSGRTLHDARAADDGLLNQATNLGVNTHMGTQFAILSRILVTAACVLLVLSVLTSYVMWWKRRPSGKVGLPARPTRRVPSKAILAVGVVSALVYPAFGVSLVLVLAVDALVGRLRGRPRAAAG